MPIKNGQQTLKTISPQKTFKSSTEYEKLLDITKYQGNVNASHGEMPPHTY